MQVQPINNQPSFGHKLIFDAKIASRATREEKTDLVELQRMFRDNGIKRTVKLSLPKTNLLKIESTNPKHASYESKPDKSDFTIENIIEMLHVVWGYGKSVSK